VVLTLNGNSFAYTGASVAALITAISNGTDDGTNDPGDEAFVASSPGTGILVIETVDFFGNKPGPPFAVSVKNSAGSLIKLIGDFGAAIVREVGVHDSVFIAQDLDTAKWNANSNPNIDFNGVNTAITIPHLTVLGTGDGSPDFYSFEITEEMIANLDPGDLGVRVIFDIDHGFELFDDVVWVSWLRLYSLVPPLDPDQPTLPTLLAQGNGINFPFDSGTTWYLDDRLEYFFKEKGTYYIEVTALYPAGDGVPVGADYELHVSITDHIEDTFIFAPEAVAEQEPENNISQDLDDTATEPDDDTDAAFGDNFFSFFDPEVGNTEHGGAID
jgi:hypothetical protein